MVINFLNKERDVKIPNDYYATIGVWRDWWKGHYAPFHEFRDLNAKDRTIKRELYSLKMAKRVCEDWASILLNEKTMILIDDEQSQRFVTGDVDGETSGVLADNEFWVGGNRLIEKAFSIGTGAFVLRVEDMVQVGETVSRSPGAKIHIDYLPANQIIPLSTKGRKITEVAFASQEIVQGKPYVYLETHEIENGEYVVRNRYFSYENKTLKKVKLPAGLAEEWRPGTNLPMFAIISPNIENTYDSANGLGMSIYAEAIDCLKGVDLAFNNFLRDFKLGGKKVFYDQELIKTDVDGNKITPDDVMQQLFYQLGDGGISEDGKRNPVHEFNPSLRVEENRTGIQAQLDYLSFKCGLGTKHYQFNGTTGREAVTATQYVGDRQDLVQNASKHYIVITAALTSLVKSILWLGKEIIGAPVNPDAKISISFDDSYVIDKESERERDRADVRDGFMQKWEYRMKWYGEDEETAKAMTAEQTPFGFGEE